MELYVLIFTILFAIIVYKIRTVGEDAFGIKLELTRYTQSLAVMLIVFVIVDIFVEPVVHGLRAVPVIIIFLFNLYGSLIVPVRSSYKKVMVGKLSNDFGPLKAFEDFLISEKGYEAFLEFSKKEFSTENIIFWKHYQQFDGTWTQAVEIYKMFLAKGR